MKSRKIFNKSARYLRLCLGSIILLTLGIIYTFIVERGIEKFVEKLQPLPAWINPKADPPNNKGQQAAPSSFQTKPKPKLGVQQKRRVEKKQQEKSPEKEQLLYEQKSNSKLSPGKQADKTQDFLENEKFVSTEIGQINNKWLNDPDFRGLFVLHSRVVNNAFKDSKRVWRKWNDSMTTPSENFEICFANIDAIKDVNTAKDKERVKKVVCRCGEVLPGIKYLVEFKIRADSASEDLKNIAEIKLTLQFLDCKLLVSRAKSHSDFISY